MVAGHGGHPDIGRLYRVWRDMAARVGFRRKAIFSAIPAGYYFSEQLTRGHVPVSGLFVGFTPLHHRRQVTAQ